MTDHYIQRKNPGYSLADKPEQRQTIESAYRGEVVLYYPPRLPKPEDELYLAIAQVSQQSNLKVGISRLSAAIEKFHPADGGYYLQLGHALSSAGDCGRALPAYDAALHHGLKTAMARMGGCIATLRQYPRAETVLKQALEVAPDDAAAWLQLGLAQLGQGKTADAIKTFEEAKLADPDLVESYNTLGAIQLESGGTALAERVLREGIRVEPNFAPIRNNLGNLLSETGRFDEAKFQFEAALRYKADYVGARYNYALALKRVGRLDEAQTQVEAILRANPDSAEAHEFLGNLYGSKGGTDRAIAQYREALRVAPDFDRANLDLGSALASQGKDKEAAPYLQKAAQSQDADIRKTAENLLKRSSQPR
jgi:tetratricopeptide (TPR) repeat protein